MRFCGLVQDLALKNGQAKNTVAGRRMADSESDNLATGERVCCFPSENALRISEHELRTLLSPQQKKNY